MSKYEEVIRKTYVKLYYIPPKQPARPVDCKQVKFTKSPEIALWPGGRGDYKAAWGLRPGDSIGIWLHDARISTHGAGGVILLLQISACIEWDVEFTSSSSLHEDLLLGYSPAPRVVRETHRVYVSLPMLYKLPGPRIALMALSPGWLKAGAYAAQIGYAFKALSHVEEVMAQILTLKKGFCPEDIRALERVLNRIETEGNSHIRQYSILPGTELGSTMPSGTGRFLGSRLA